MQLQRQLRSCWRLLLPLLGAALLPYPLQQCYGWQLSRRCGSSLRPLPLLLHLERSCCPRQPLLLLSWSGKWVAACLKCWRSGHMRSWQLCRAYPSGSSAAAALCRCPPSLPTRCSTSPQVGPGGEGRPSGPLTFENHVACYSWPVCQPGAPAFTQPHVPSPCLLLPLLPLPPVGEYLMMLPQQLESALLSDENTDEAGQLVADWIDKVRAAGSYLVHCMVVGSLQQACRPSRSFDLELTT